MAEEEKVLNINVKEDDSVKRAIEDVARRLQGKYTKKRKINEKLLAPRSKWFRALTIILNILCIIVIVCATTVFVSIVSAKAQNIPPSFGGYTMCEIASPSMEAEGEAFKKGNVVTVRNVDTKTLKEGDIIAYYYYDTVNVVDGESFFPVDTSDFETKYSLTFAEFFGGKNDSIKEAASKKASRIFHKIVDVREDENGTRWFRTWGVSNYATKDDPNSEDGTVIDYDNPLYDNWYVSEDMVFGIYDNSSAGGFFSGLVKTFSNGGLVIIILLVPLCIVGLIIMLGFLKDIQIYKLQLDVIEEKRKITDSICVKNKVGLKMDNKSKYKVLAQADDADKNEYISLLWEDGKAPRGIKKYCLRKKMYLKPVEKLLKVNRECERRLKKGEDPLLVANYYTKEKEKLQKEQLEFERQFRSWMREDRKDLKQLKQKQKAENKNSLKPDNTNKSTVTNAGENSSQVKVDKNSSANVGDKK